MGDTVLDSPPEDSLGYVIGAAIAGLIAALTAMKKYGVKLFAPNFTSSMTSINTKLDEQTKTLHEQTATLGGISVTLGRYDERLLAMDRRISRLEGRLGDQ